MRFLPRLIRFSGFPARSHGANEQIIATVGGFIGIFAVMGISLWLLGPGDAVIVVPSLGASAVLIFAVPHSPLTQPWALVGGNVISAFIGVACAQAVPNTLIAAALAVGLAIGAMHLTRSIHPPGGATALAAVIGSPALHDLGYAYVLAPIALSALVILVVGVVFNAPFPWRRYPMSLMHYARPMAHPGTAPGFSEAQIEAAMRKLKVVLDVTPQEVGQILSHVLHATGDARPHGHLTVGTSYCNDQPGPLWSIRQIIDERPSDDPALDLIVYRVTRGAQRDMTGSCTRDEFAHWARSEVET